MGNNVYTSGTYKTKNPTWHKEDSFWKAGKIADILRANSVEPRTLAEIGCGAGEVLSGVAKELSPRPHRSHGFDISPHAISLAESMNSDPSISYTVGKPDGHFDVVLLIDVIEHVPDYFGFVAEAATCGSIICAHIPLAISALTALRPRSIMEARESVGHIHLFTEETAMALFTDLGYELIDSTFTAGSIELTSASPLAAAARLPRKLALSLHPAFARKLLGGFSLLLLAKSPNTNGIF